MATQQACLDDILKEIGDFGKYQKKIAFFISIATMLSFLPTFIWIFETKQSNYRCEQSGCETYPTEYKPVWWTDAIPSVNGNPSKCEKYKASLNDSKQWQKCNFNKSIVESCDTYVYETTEISILRDFNLYCDDNIWKLTLVGTINSVGLIIGQPISGFLADKFGRKKVLIFTVTLSAICGLIRSFSNTYIFFLIMVLIGSICKAGSFPSCIVLGAELVTPNKRSLISGLISICTCISAALVGGLAWVLLNWRTLDQILYGVSLIILLYFWVLPESIRWLLVNKKYNKVENMLQKVAKTNGKDIPLHRLEKLWDSNKVEKSSVRHPLRLLFKSPILLKRLMQCSVCWICSAFAAEGLTINSVNLSKNSYLDFILTVLVKIPGNIVVYLLVDRIGRRICFAIGFGICGISCLGFIFIPEDLYWLKICVYLFGKLGVSIAVFIINTITSEIFPTDLRSSLFSICYMAANVGSMVAPQAILLQIYWQHFPLTLFAVVSLVGTAVSLLLPETTDIKLPDTVYEVEHNMKKTQA